MNRSSGREAVTFGSSCRSDPAAALRGFANRGSPDAARPLLMASNALAGRYTSPRTSRNAGGRAPRSRSGRLLIVLRLAVTSSPWKPSPRVAPRTKAPPSYVSDTAAPSILSSQTYSTRWSPRADCTRRTQARSSSSSNALARLSIG